MSAHHAYRDRNWSTQPHAETTLRAILADTLARAPEAAAYAQALHEGAGVRLRDVIDHVAWAGDTAPLAEAGWAQGSDGAWRNPAGLFPPFVPAEETCLWLRAESVEAFLKANRIDAAIEGAEHGPYRRAHALPGLGVVERHGHAGFDVPATDPALIRSARIHGQRFRARRREWDAPEGGLAATEALVEAAVADIGAHWACDLWLRAEREYWLRNCAAGRLQKARQDRLGIGFSNIDHHTYDSSRAHFRHTIRILQKLGYELREMIYAGELAGWGSQVLEQPAIGSTIFADVDLAPHELDIDFAHEALPPLDRHRRAGVLCFLHGESILEQGLNHVACLFDQAALRQQLGEHGIGMMAPFSAMPHLYQELTHGDWKAVDPARVDALEAQGHIDAAEAERLRLQGAIVTHLENIERNEGYKGFNKPGIDGVLRKLDPRAYDGLEAAE